MLLSLKVFVFAAIGLAAANDEGPDLMRYNQATDGNRVLQSKQDKSAKVPKLPKAQKVKSKSAKASTPPQHDMPGEYPPQYLNPAYWHPKLKNFEIMDWDRFYAQNPTVPKVYDPPQRELSDIVFKYSPFGWWHRSNLGAPDIDDPSWPKPLTGTIDDPDLGLLKGLLGKSPYSSKVPPAFRNSVFWMQNNEGSETLVSFNRGAWRSNTKEGRAVGLASMRNDWTNSPNVYGYDFANNSDDAFINFQVSPCGKWIKLFVISEYANPCDEEAYGGWLTMYVVQEDDEFFDKDGKKLTDIKPGDIYRTTYELRWDPYEADNDKLIFTYVTRKIAMIDELSGGILINPPMYNRLVEFATREPPQELSERTNGFTDDSMLSREERWDLQVGYLSNEQKYKSAPEPPPSELIENIEDSDTCMA